MSNLPSETTLAQRRLHWGIFIVPLIVLAALFLLTLPVMFLFRLMESSLEQLNPQPSNPVSGLSILIWFLPEILVGVPLILIVLSAYLKSNITLTNRRLIYRTGLLSRVTGELPLNNVEAIFLAESPLGRLLGYGTVIVTGVGGLRFPLQYVPTPIEFHAQLQNAVNAAKSPVRPTSNLPTPPIQDDSRYMPKG